MFSKWMGKKGGVFATDRRREKLSDRIYRIVQDLFFSFSGAEPAPQAECFSCAGVSAAHEKNNLSAPSASLR
jgi:hypothetical protein